MIEIAGGIVLAVICLVAIGAAVANFGLVARLVGVLLSIAFLVAVIGANLSGG